MNDKTMYPTKFSMMIEHLKTDKESFINDAKHDRYIGNDTYCDCVETPVHTRFTDKIILSKCDCAE